MAGIKMFRTIPYHPQGDPQPKQFIQILLNILGTLHPEQKTTWSQYVVALVHAYNATKHSQEIQPEERVLLKNLDVAGKHKIADR